MRSNRCTEIPSNPDAPGSEETIISYTRTGNTLRWEATVEDPDVLVEPYHVEGRTLRLNPNTKATLTDH